MQTSTSPSSPLPVLPRAQRLVATQALYLLGCALNRLVPDAALVSRMDREALLRFARRHQLDALLAWALQSCGQAGQAERRILYRAMYRAGVMDAARTQLLAFLEERGIWHAPLKGVVLRNFYPKPFLRQMSDNDILFDPSFREEVRAHMLAEGYHRPAKIRVMADEARHHDVYHKLPCLNFEMHLRLFSFMSDIGTNKPLREYYENVTDRLLAPGTDGSRCLRVLSDEDVHVYVTAHAYKHFVKAEIGLRTLADAAMFLQARGASLDWARVAAECARLGLAEYEKTMRGLAAKVFGPEAAATLAHLLRDESAEQPESALNLTPDEAAMLGRLLRPGSARLQVADAGGRLNYALREVFPPRDFFRALYPRLVRVPVLWPLCYPLRVLEVLWFRPDSLTRHLGVIRRGGAKEEA